jgi:hypothetical protein
MIKIKNILKDVTYIKKISKIFHYIKNDGRKGFGKGNRKVKAGVRQ